MIKSKLDYIYYLESDRLGMHITDRKKPRFLRDEVWRYLCTLRRVEYLMNCKNGPFWHVNLLIYKNRLHKLGLKTGFTIPINVFGPGLTLFHYGTIVVNDKVKVGEDCQLYTSTNIAEGVEIGNKVFIAPGVKILNGIKIADGIRIGANSVVNKSFLEADITIAGIPAKKVSDKGTKEHYIGGTEQISKS